MAKRKGGGKAAGRGLEVEEAMADDDAVAQPAAGVESGLVVLTFVALVVALVLSQMELGNSFGKGLLG